MESSPTKPSRRALLERSWVVGVVLFTIARFFVAYGTLNRYHVNIWYFGAIDLLTAVPYGIGTARVVGSLVDRHYQATARWGAIAAFCFLAPYLYVALAGRTHQVPNEVYVVLGVLVVCFGLNAGIGIRRRVRSAETEAAATAASQPTAV
jgi:hypothetical protein